MRVNTLEIRTPEGVAFSYSLAGPATRFLAWIIDRACIVACYMALMTLQSLLMAAFASFGELMGRLGFDLLVALGMVAYFVLNTTYAIGLEWYWGGQTLGKRLLHLRVMDEQGLHLHFSQIVVRNLLRAVDGLPALYLVGGAACLLSRRAQRLGDFAANTVVVHVPRPFAWAGRVAPSDKYNSLREHPHLAARLRQRLSPEATHVALEAVIRRDELEPAARVRLFGEVAEYFRALVPFPEPATVGVTDEQYVRNVLDLVLHPKPVNHGTRSKRPCYNRNVLT